MPPAEAIAAVLRGDLAAVCIDADGRIDPHPSLPTVLLPGSFNPLHEGHLGLAAAASKITGQAAAFELSVSNVDKPPLELHVLRHRIDQFTGKATVWLTQAPTFVEKARLFPGAIFVVGADTAERIVAEKYYGGGDQLLAALALIRSQGGRFLVAVRETSTGKCLRLEDLLIPLGYADLFREISENEFQLAVSSSELRRACRLSL